MTARPRRAVFEPFSWHGLEDHDDTLLRFSTRVKDLSAGLHKCLEMLEISHLDREHCRDQDPPAPGELPDVPLLSDFDAGVLTRFTIAVARVIAEDAAEIVEARARQRDERKDGVL